ncbi:protein RFT1 homolog [Lethenteron reissneri]|uniref:protein RFT1 homolog n=1 Tax=Lethenteron reissneri TaxID=7753 RepID=UPI002AB64E61|nr:protein RFT1 homolog [Lethenteron reissneri]
MASDTTKALQGASILATYNVLLQVSFRVITFVLNAFILRHLSKEVLGVVNVRLTLLYSTTVFLAREAFRRACLSRASTADWRRVINLLWMTVPLGAVCAGALGYVWTRWLEAPDAEHVPAYPAAVWVFAVSAVVELLSEPFWVLAQAHMFVRLRVSAESLALGSRSILTVALVFLRPDWGLWVFAFSQLTYAVVLSFCYYRYFTRYIGSTAAKDSHFPITSVRQMFFTWGTQPFDWAIVSLTRSFMMQSFLKQLLTEGEKYIMTFFNVLNFGDQGIYDVVNNLGSMVPRFIFMPIEDSFYVFFARSLSRGKIAMEQNEDDIAIVAKVLQSLLKLVLLIGVTVLTFGFSYSYLALDLYGGSLLSSSGGPVLLRWYSAYVLFLALNGITECFVFAAMKQSEVDRYNMKLLVLSVVFLVLSYALTRAFGSVGFVLANCLNMALRLASSLNFIVAYFRGTPHEPLAALRPNLVLAFTFFCSWVITATSEWVLCCDHGKAPRLLHVTLGAACLSAVVIVTRRTERELVSFVWHQFLPEFFKKKQS